MRGGVGERGVESNISGVEKVGTGERSSWVE